MVITIDITPDEYETLKDALKSLDFNSYPIELRKTILKLHTESAEWQHRTALLLDLVDYDLFDKLESAIEASNFLVSVDEDHNYFIESWDDLIPF